MRRLGPLRGRTGTRKQTRRKRRTRRRRNEGRVKEHPPTGEHLVLRLALEPEAGFGQPERPIETVKSSSTSSSPSSSFRKKKKTEDKDKAKQAKDRGPFGAGAEMDYGDGGGDSGDSTDESRLFREGPHSGGSSLQLQLQEYALPDFCKRCRSWSRGGPLTTSKRGSRTPTMMAQAASAASSSRDADLGDGPPRSLPVRGRRVGSEDQSAGAVPERRHMEQSAGPSLLGRGEAVMRPRNAGELRMRRLQSKGSGKAEQKGGNKDGGRTEQKTAPPQSGGGAGHGPGTRGSGRGTSRRRPLSAGLF